LADGLRHPAEKDRAKGDTFFHRGRWKLSLERGQRFRHVLLPNPLKRAHGFAGGAVRGKQHPLRRILHFDGLGARLEPPTLPGRQIDELGRHMHRSPERIRGRAVYWRTIENYVIDFRGSDDFGEWRKLTAHRFAGTRHQELGCCGRRLWLRTQDGGRRKRDADSPLNFRPFRQPQPEQLCHDELGPR
jgi:hypothetical protein